MELQIQRETLLKPLQLVSGAVEKRQTLPVLSHVLMKVNGQSLSLIATDLEVEMKEVHPPEFITLWEPGHGPGGG